MGTRESSFASHNVATFSGLLSLIYFGATDPRSEIPATPAHAAPCPPKEREHFVRGVAKEPLGRTVDAARLWPEHRYNMRYNMQLADLECKT